MILAGNASGTGCRDVVVIVVLYHDGPGAGSQSRKHDAWHGRGRRTDGVCRGVGVRRQKTVGHTGGKTPPTDKGAGSQSPWLEGGGSCKRLQTIGRPSLPRSSATRMYVSTIHEPLRVQWRTGSRRRRSPIKFDVARTQAG